MMLQPCVHFLTDFCTFFGEAYLSLKFFFVFCFDTINLCGGMWFSLVGFWIATEIECSGMKGPT